MNIINDLKTREIFKDITNYEKFQQLKRGDGVYVGFDPTAPSLHLGNYVQIATLKRFQAAGFKVYAVLGGATGMIGDPSGKSEERNLLDDKTVLKHKTLIKKQLSDFKFIVLDNLDFYKTMSVIEYLRNIGKLLNVNYMINKETVKSRLDSGISYTEFSYQLIQGWDFKMLYEKYNVKVQIGGSDQWGNITSGVEIIRKTLGENNQAIGITINLLLNNSGQKFGKSEGNVLWLDSNLTSPYELYQYLLNSDDESAIKYLNWLTFLDIQNIEKIKSKHQKTPSKRYAQEILAFEVTKDIHGTNNAKIAQKISNILFGTAKFSDLSKSEILNLSKIFPPIEVKTMKLIDLLVLTKIVSSKREVKELINNQAIHLNNQSIHDADMIIDAKTFPQKYLLLKKGKKSYYLLKLK